MFKVQLNEEKNELEVLPTTIEDWTPKTAFEYLNAWGGPYAVEDNGNGTYTMQYDKTIITAKDYARKPTGSTMSTKTSTMQKIALIACSKAKHPDSHHQPIPAKDLYTGQLFQAAWAYANALGLADEQIFVLSAKFCLVKAWPALYYYDDTLTRQRVQQRRSWARGVLAQMEAAFTLEGLEVYVLAGKLYRQYLITPLEDKRARIHLPVPAGLGYAQQVGWLKKQVQKGK